MKTYDVFISYRRTGGFELAEILYNRLTDLGYSVFLDIESLRSGKFNEALLQRIDECQDILLILPPNALDRCVNEDDWVRREIAWAIAKGKNIIPIYMNGFIMPEELPEGMEELPIYNAIIASSKTFDQTLAEIVSWLHSKRLKQSPDGNSNSDFMKIATWMNHHILEWRIAFFPIAAFSLFEAFMLIPNDDLQWALSQMDESNFAAVRMIYLVLASTLSGAALWLSSKIARGMKRFFVGVGLMFASCCCSQWIVSLMVWDGTYRLWGTPLGISMFIFPWVIAGIAILCTFIVRLIFVYVLEVE